MDFERTAGSLHHDHHHGIHHHHHHFHFGSRVDVGAPATTDCSRPIDCDTGTRRAVLPIFLGVLITLIGFILVMVGYFEKPRNYGLFVEDIQRQRNCRITGWVLMPIGVIVFTLGVMYARRIRAKMRQQSVEAGNEQQQQRPQSEDAPPPSLDTSSPPGATVTVTAYLPAPSTSSAYPVAPYPPVATEPSADLKMCDPSKISQGSAGMNAPPSYNEATTAPSAFPQCDNNVRLRQLCITVL